MIFFAQICWCRHKKAAVGRSHRVLLGNDHHRTTMQGTVTFIQSEPATRWFTRPYLRRAARWEALIGDGGGWRLIGRGSDPTAVLLEGGLIQEDMSYSHRTRFVAGVCVNVNMEFGSICLNVSCCVLCRGLWESQTAGWGVTAILTDLSTVCYGHNPA